MTPPSGGSLFRFQEDTLNKDKLVKTQFWVMKGLRRKVNNDLRLEFLMACKVNHILPRFLSKLKFPKIEAYRPEKVLKFQFKTLEEEITRLKTKIIKDEDKFENTKKTFYELCKILTNKGESGTIRSEDTNNDVFELCMALIISKVESEKVKIKNKLDKKLEHLALIQKRSIGILNESAVMKVGMDVDIPVAVLNTLSRGPKCPVRSKFD